MKACTGSSLHELPAIESAMGKATFSLSDRQARFVDEYLVDSNGTRAAVAAGYGRNGARVAAHRLTNSNTVRAAIAARQGVEAKRLQIDRHGVIQALLEASNLARDQRNPAAMVAAAREIGRMLGFYSATEHRVVVEQSATRSERRRYESMTDAELQARIDGASFAQSERASGFASHHGRYGFTS